ncbi:hypothetical protein MP638_006087 [Amoeboaphelidium occidentale]|nr:hypothetical protein MP638_006087 [Amoeboaphelidium occidentale]
MIRILRNFHTSSKILNGYSGQRFPHPPRRLKNNYGDTVLYTSSVLIALVGVTYAAVPLYRMFCQATGYAGTVKTDASETLNPAKMVPQKQSRRLKISFNADTSTSLPWTFKPQQTEVFVYPGETALVFYTAKNTSDHDVVGVSTYNVTPMKCGAYFNKIQCFCFEEQLLRPGEEVDMPVFFYIDPEIAKDPLMKDVRDITLSYTFFKAQ